MKKKLLKVLSMILSVVMAISMFIGVAACGNNKPEEEKPGPVTPVNPDPDKPDEPAIVPQGSLVVAYSNFSNKFSPFFATSAYDVDVYTMTQVPLLAGDRGGNIVYKGIEGEVVPYNGTNYTYYGLSDLTVTQNADGSVYYDIQMRTGNKAIKFSDGKTVGVKDAIFSMYVYSDSDYDGSTTFYSLPIKGMAEWRTNLSSDIYAKWSAISKAILATIAETGNFDYVAGEGYTEAQFTSLAAALQEGAWVELARDIVNYVASNYSNYLSSYNNSEVAAGMALWGFSGEGEDENLFYDSNGKSYTLEGDDVPTLDDYAACLKAAYKDDIFTAASVEQASGDIDSYFAAPAEKWIATSGSTEMEGDITSISGITYDEEKGTIRVETTEFSATTVYQLSIAVAPLHYYGSESLWDPANGSYGFTRGNLNGVREKTTTPMGAGPYKFVSYTGGIVTFEANENYWEGTPRIKNIMFKEYSKDEDKLPALLNGEVDVAEPSISQAVCDQIKKANNDEKLWRGSSVVAADLIDNNGYGYIGINSERVLVGTEKGSDASKDLRKALATLFAAYREYTVNSYYEDRASVIEYPISNCSWAAPQPADEGYKTAFSTDVNGDAIYTADMNDEARYAAALEAAKGFFKAAGYTYDEATGKFTAAPDGAKLEYEAIIGGGGTGDHPTFALLNKAAEALDTIGIKLTVTDISSSSVLFARMEAGTADIFVAAWGGSSDPDMYQVYHSSNATGSNHYRIADAELDQLILSARTKDDKVYRKGVYKECLDIILDWAVEIPVYQRKNCIVYSVDRVNIATLTPDPTPFWSYLAEIYKVEVK